MNDPLSQSGRPRVDRFQQWARRQLGVAEQASPAELQASLLARVEQANFVPEPAVLAAYRALRAATGGPTELAASSEFQRAEEQELLAEAERLASQLLQLPADERRRRWQELYHRSGQSLRIRGRLEALRPGLGADLSVVDPHDRFAVRLSESLRELFPLSPAERAVRRNALSTQLRSLDGFKRGAVKRYRRRYPQLAALDTALLERLAEDPSARPKRRYVRAARPAARPSGPAIVTRREDKGNYWWVIGLILMLSALARGVATFDRSSGPTRSSDVYRTPYGGTPNDPRTTPGQGDTHRFENRDEAAQVLQKLLRELKTSPSPDSGNLPPTSHPAGAPGPPRVSPGVSPPGSPQVPPGVPPGVSPQVSPRVSPRIPPPVSPQVSPQVSPPSVPSPRFR